MKNSLAMPLTNLPVGKKNNKHKDGSRTYIPQSKWVLIKVAVISSEDVTSGKPHMTLANVKH